MTWHKVQHNSYHKFSNCRAQYESSEQKRKIYVKVPYLKMSQIEYSAFHGFLSKNYNHLVNSYK